MGFREAILRSVISTLPTAILFMSLIITLLLSYVVSPLSAVIWLQQLTWVQCECDDSGNSVTWLMVINVGWCWEQRAVIIRAPRSQLLTNNVATINLRVQEWQNTLSYWTQSVSCSSVDICWVTQFLSLQWSSFKTCLRRADFCLESEL